MSLSGPSAVIQYLDPVSGWTEIQSRLINYEITLRELAAGMSQATFEFDDADNNLMQNVFPAFGTEKGCYWPFRAKVNNRYLLNGRLYKVDPKVGKKDTVEILARCYGQELLRKLIDKNYVRDPKYADDMVEDFLTVIKAVDVQYSSPHDTSLPVLTPDYTDKCPYACDAIREIAERIDYSAFVKTQADVTKGTLLFFPKNDAGKRHSTILRNILFDDTNNIQEGNMPRSIDELCNLLALVGRLSYFEPPGGDEWTDDPNMKGWYSWDGGMTHVRWWTRAMVGNYSVCGDISSTKGPCFGLTLPEVLSEDFDCVKRKGTSLNFYFMVSHGSESASKAYQDFRQDAAVRPIVILRDAAENQIQCLLYNSIAYDLTGSVWRKEGIPIGSDDYIYMQVNAPGAGGVRVIGGPWSVYDGKLGKLGAPGCFDWSKIRYVWFQDTNDKRKMPLDLWIAVDQLYFGQSYQPVYIAQDLYSQYKYGVAMQKPMKTEFASYAALKAYGDEYIKGTARPTLLLPLTAVIDQGAESLFPGYSIQADVPRLGITPGSPWFRILEIKYQWSPFHTTFQLIPSTVA